MNELLVTVVASVLASAKYSWGTFANPYQTYRHLAARGGYREMAPLLVGIALYFVLLSPLRARTLHPLLLTFGFGKLLGGFIVSFVVVVALLYGAGRLFGGRGDVRSVAVAWGFSLVPTLLWFVMTSFFYVLLPPPRHLSVGGRAFSIVFFSASLALFFWKGILYYLTLRFGMRLDFARIMGVSVVVFPLLMAYAYGLYDAGIFRVPFI